MKQRNNSGQFIKTIKDKRCFVCNKIFHPRLSKQKVCSIKCRTKILPQCLSKRKKRVCKYCKKEFLPKTSYKPIYCSKECFKKGQSKCRIYKKEKYYKFKCKICDKKFNSYLRKDGIKPKFCSHKCYATSIKGKTSWSKGCKFPKRCGKNHPRWKGGYKRKLWNNNKRRIMKTGNGGSHTLEDWENLKAQYNWTCPCCKKSEPKIKLTEDHIVPLSQGGSDNIENIQPLCRSCNSKKHNKIIKY